MVTFKESFTTGHLRYNSKMILGAYSNLVCKLMYDNTKGGGNKDYYYIYLLSTTTNPFLFTFKTI
jgi:hypothetical protein